VGVQVMNALLLPLVLGFLFLLARRLYTEKEAFATVVIFTVIPLCAGGGFIMTYDPVMMACWSTAAYAVWITVNSPIEKSREISSYLPWAASGALAGLTIMAKLNGLVILPAILLYLICSKEKRGWLRRPHPYAAAALALLIFTPFLWWNHTHGNAYWLHGHQMGLRGTGKPFAAVANFGDFLGGQALVISPLVFLTYLRLMASPRGGKSEDADKWCFLWALSVVGTAVTALVSLHNKVEANWTVMAYMTGSVLIAREIVQTWGSPRLRYWHIASLIFAAILSLGAFLLPKIAVSKHLDVDPLVDRTTETRNWPDVAARVEFEQASVGGAGKSFIFGANYRVPSILSFYLPGHPTTYSLCLHTRENNYMFWDDPNKRLGQNAVFVNDGDSPTDTLDECRSVFEKVDSQPEIKIYRPGGHLPIRVLQVFRCYNFKGYVPSQWQSGW